MELVANFEISEGEQFDTLFKIDTQLEVKGEGVINAITSDGVVTVTSTTYTHEQAIASDVWVIEHNLNKRPSYVVVDSAGRVQMPDEVDYNNENTITLYFISAFAGQAYLN